MKPLFSVVMAYFNRKPLLLRTLNSISASKQASNTEVVIVDDGSVEEHRLEDIVNNYNFKIKLIRIEPEEKWYTNPCIPFNKGFKEAEADTIIIQNPECYHFGDILDYSTKLKSNQYFSYHAYSLNQEVTEQVDHLNPVEINSKGYNFYDHPHADVAECLPSISSLRLPNVGTNLEGKLGYYNHRTFRPHAFHFCCAIKREDLLDLEGFDERYAEGRAFDDNEFILRVGRKGLDVIFVSYPLVLHQWHYEGYEPDFGEKFQRNMHLFQNITMQERGWRVN